MSRLSDRFGIPTLISPDLSIIEAPVRPTLRAMAEVARKDSVISSLLSQHKPNNGSAHFFPILKAFESELEILEMQFRECQSPLLDRLLSSIKLRLYSYSLQLSNSQPDSDLRNRNRRDGTLNDHLHTANYVSKAFALAMRVINSSLDENTNAESSQERISRSCALWTFVDLQSFVMAVFIVLQLARKHQNLFDSNQVTDAIQQACSMLRSCSVVDGDHFYRVCDIISYMVENRSTAAEETGASTDVEDVAPTIRPSMGVGVAHDIVKEAKKRYRRRKRFPEQFPEADASTNMGNFEAESVASSEDWLQVQLPQTITADFNLLMWPSWDGGAEFGFANGDSTSFH